MHARPPRGSKAQQILFAAGSLFAEAGYEGTSLNEVACRARVSKANVIHHYGCKEALYLAVVNDAIRESAAAVEEIVGQKRPEVDKLRDLCGHLLGTMCGNPERTRVVMREVIEHGSTRGHELARQVFRRNFQAELSLFSGGQSRGAFRRDMDPVIAWLVLISSNLIFFLCRDVLRHHEEFSYADAPERFADALCDVLVRGIAARPDVPRRKPARRRATAPALSRSPRSRSTPKS